MRIDTRKRNEYIGIPSGEVCHPVIGDIGPSSLGSSVPRKNNGSCAKGPVLGSEGLFVQDWYRAMKELLELLHPGSNGVLEVFVGGGMNVDVDDLGHERLQSLIGAVFMGLHRAARNQEIIDIVLPEACLLKNFGRMLARHR